MENQIMTIKKIKPIPWYKWPQKPNNHFPPLYIILWRWIWMPMFVVFMVLASFPVFMAYGWTSVKDLWRNL